MKGEVKTDTVDLHFVDMLEQISPAYTDTFETRHKCYAARLML